MVSSAHLALERVRQIGPAQRDETVVINHTDCDSVLAAAILLGLVEPDDRLARAAEAADHTGVDDEIADALQALDARRDFALSLHTLRRIFCGAGVGEELSDDLQVRAGKRSRARACVSSFRHVGPVAWAELDEQVDGELFPALLPDAEIIVVGCKSPRSDRWFIKVRLGLAAKSGSSLQNLEITTMDPAYGGRWNAGSNKRGGGSLMGPDAYAEHIAGRLAEAVEQGGTPK